MLTFISCILTDLSLWIGLHQSPLMILLLLLWQLVLNLSPLELQLDPLSVAPSGQV